MPRKSSRRSKDAPEDPEVSTYSDLLAEVLVPADASEENTRPRKKRKTANASSNISQTRHDNSTLVSLDTPSGHAEDETVPASSPNAEVRLDELGSETKSISSKPQEQVVYDSSSEASEESDLDLTDYVGGDFNAPARASEQEVAKASDGEIKFEVGVNTPSRSRAAPGARLPSSAAEKKKRVEIHKWHILCLLSYNHIRNHWCNDPPVQASVSTLVTPKIRSLLHPKTSFSQTQRTSSFVDGLEQLSAIWRSCFRVTLPGMRQAQWNSTKRLSLHYDLDIHVDKEDFLRAAAERQGSRDEGAQLFCAMLRSVGVEARLVCSLQPLPFGSGVAQSIATSPPSKPSVTFDEFGRQLSTPSPRSSPSPPASETSPAQTHLQPIRRFGARPADHAARLTHDRKPRYDPGRLPPSAIKRKKITDAKNPVYWVEAFNVAHQKWVPVDVFATRTVNRAHKIEPPLSDPLNSLTYAVAFSADLSARDVTRRYAKAYNAKTRRTRVESTRDGRRWWSRTMKIFRRPRSTYDDEDSESKDAIEDAELAKREAAEGMPRNIADFKDHPVYALERHLRRNEVIHPCREAGRLAAGKDGAAEPIFRRQDVQVVKSSDKWYRAGHIIKEGEQPLKYGKARSAREKRRSTPDGDDDDDGEADGEQSVGLYAEFQTELFVPTAVERGRVPKNQFGNLDVYVPSMIPPGGAHVRSSDAREAARIVQVDYVDAVVGFTFKGRKGTAVVRGVVVPRENCEAVEEVVRGLRSRRAEIAAANRRAEALKMWKQLLQGLRIRERVMKNMGDQVDEQKMQDRVEEEQDREDYLKAEGGFFIDQDVHIPEPTKPEGAGGMSALGDLPDVDINDFAPAGNKKRHFWEPTVFSPWDIGKSVFGEDSAQPAANDGDNEDLFGDGEGAGGFVREGDGGRPPAQEEDTVGQYGGGFVANDDDDDDEAGRSGAALGGGFMALAPDAIDEHGADRGGGFILPSHADGTGEEDEPTLQMYGEGTPKVSRALGDNEPLASLDARSSSAGGGGGGRQRRVAADGHDLPGEMSGEDYEGKEEQEAARSIKTVGGAAAGTTVAAVKNEVGAAAPDEQQEEEEMDEEKVVRSRRRRDEPSEPSPSDDGGGDDGGDDGDDDDDAGSLLSQDPDDEDAEPDWLAEEATI